MTDILEDDLGNPFPIILSLEYIDKIQNRVSPTDFKLNPSTKFVWSDQYREVFTTLLADHVSQQYRDAFNEKVYVNINDGVEIITNMLHRARNCMKSLLNLFNPLGGTEIVKLAKMIKMLYSINIVSGCINTSQTYKDKSVNSLARFRTLAY